MRAIIRCVGPLSWLLEATIMQKALRSLLLGTLGMLLYIPGATATCVFIFVLLMPEPIDLAPKYLLFPVAYFLGAVCISLMSSNKPNYSHLFAFIVVPVAGAASYSLVSLFVHSDKTAVTLGAPIAGIVMFIAAKLAMLVAQKFNVAEARNV